MIDQILHSTEETEWTYFLKIFPIFVSCIDQENDEENNEDDDRQVDGLVSHEIHVGKYIAPVDGIGQDKKTTSECCQMCRQTLCFNMICF